MAKVLVGNLPPGTTAEDIQELFRELGAEVEVPRIDGKGSTLTATIQIGIDQTTAQILTDRSKGRMFRGRKLSVYTPRFLK